MAGTREQSIRGRIRGTLGHPVATGLHQNVRETKDVLGGTHTFSKVVIDTRKTASTIEPETMLHSTVSRALNILHLGQTEINSIYQISMSACSHEEITRLDIAVDV